MLRLATLSLFGLVVGCGGDDRSPTAPLLPQPYGQPTCSEYDVGSDGTVDEVYAYMYDDDGFQIRFDGVYSGTGVTTYDPDHFYLSFTQTKPNETTPFFEEHLTRDPDGRILTYESLYDGQRSSYTVTYDEQGRRVHVMDVSENGTTTESTYMYTGDELNPTTVRQTYAGGASVATYTSSNGERTIHVDIDDGEDGSIDRTQDTTLDDKRRVLTSVIRTDGQVTSREAYTYTDRGQVASQVFADDEAADDYVFTGQYDQRGWWLQSEVTSPSGAYESSIYREIAKDACTSLGSTVRRAQRPMLRRPAADPAIRLAPPPAMR